MGEVTFHPLRSIPVRWQVGGCSEGPPAAASAALRRPSEEEPAASLPPVFPFPPDSCITTWRSDSVVALLSNPVATAADTSPHISTQSAKSAAADCLISIYSCDVSSPPPLCSWITFRLYCTVLRKEKKKRERKEKQGSGLPVYGSCQEAVMLGCYAQHTHGRLMNSWASRCKKKVDLCKCLHGFLFMCACAGLKISFRSFIYYVIINIAGLKKKCIYIHIYLCTHIHKRALSQQHDITTCIVVMEAGSSCY